MVRHATRVGLVLSALLLVGCGQGRRTFAPPKPKEPEEPEAVYTPAPPKRNKAEIFGGQTINDTGVIVFICGPQTGASHEEKEVEIRKCPMEGCGKMHMFLQHEGHFWCYSCEKQIPEEKIRCDEPGCTVIPKRPKLKHK